MRYAAGIEYDGTHFRGWQTQQKGVRTVQGALERALSHVADEPVSAVCAGRTDAGVHAVGQVVHFDTAAERPDHAWILGANSNLPDDVAVRWLRSVPDSFHARYSANARSYRYYILNQWTRRPLLRHRAWWHHRELDAEAMAAGARHLVGERDFTSFRAADCQSKTPWRNVHDIRIAAAGPMITIDVSANAFLHHMIRNIVGTLAVVGRGEAEPAWVREVLERRDRRVAGITAPAQGLHFFRVAYDGAFDFPAPEEHELAV